MAELSEMTDAAIDDWSVDELVLATVADAEGVDSGDIDDLLYDVIDPDALNDIFRNASADVQLRFHFCGYEVTVLGNRAVRLAILNE